MGSPFLNNKALLSPTFATTSSTLFLNKATVAVDPEVFLTGFDAKILHIS